MVCFIIVIVFVLFSSTAVIFLFFLLSLYQFVVPLYHFIVSQEVLGDLPQKTFTDVSVPIKSSPLEVPSPLPPAPASAAAGGGAGQGAGCSSKGEGNPAAMAALDRVLRLLQVGSKRFLTNKASEE